MGDCSFQPLANSKGGMKVIRLTTGDITDVWMFFFRSTKSVTEMKECIKELTSRSNGWGDERRKETLKEYYWRIANMLGNDSTAYNLQRFLYMLFRRNLRFKFFD